MFSHRVDNDLHIKGLLLYHPLNGGHADPQVVCVEHVELLDVHELLHVVLGHLEGEGMFSVQRVGRLPEPPPGDAIGLHIVSTFHL